MEVTLYSMTDNRALGHEMRKVLKAYRRSDTICESSPRCVQLAYSMTPSIEEMSKIEVVADLLINEDVNTPVLVMTLCHDASFRVALAILAAYAKVSPTDLNTICAYIHRTNCGNDFLVDLFNSRRGTLIEEGKSIPMIHTICRYQLYYLVPRLEFINPTWSQIKDSNGSTIEDYCGIHNTDPTIIRRLAGKMIS